MRRLWGGVMIFVVCVLIGVGAFFFLSHPEAPVDSTDFSKRPAGGKGADEGAPRPAATAPADSAVFNQEDDLSMLYPTPLSAMSAFASGLLNMNDLAKLAQNYDEQQMFEVMEKLLGEATDDTARRHIIRVTLVLDNDMAKDFLVKHALSDLLASNRDQAVRALGSLPRLSDQDVEALLAGLEKENDPQVLEGYYTMMGNEPWLFQEKVRPDVMLRHLALGVKRSYALVRVAGQMFSSEQRAELATQLQSKAVEYQGSDDALFYASLLACCGDASRNDQLITILKDERQDVFDRMLASWGLYGQAHVPAVQDVLLDAFDRADDMYLITAVRLFWKNAAVSPSATNN